MIKVGLVGLGFMGQMHYGVYSKSKKARITAIADVEPEKRKGDVSKSVGNIPGAARQLDLTGVEVFSTVEDLIAKADVDLVDICLPTYLHAKYTIMALKAGRHVMCEKPMALTAKDAAKMATVARASKGYLMIGHCIRFWPEYVYLRDVIKKKTYGGVLAARFTRLSPAPVWAWKNWLLNGAKSGGAEVDLHIHDTDFVIHAFGKPKSVYAVGVKQVSGAYDYVVAHYRYAKKNLSIVAEGGWGFPAAYPFRMFYNVQFEKATVEYSSMATPTITVYQKDGRVQYPKMSGPDGYHSELNYFLECIRKGKAPKTVTPADAALSVKVIEKEISSIKQGRPVTIT